MPDLDNMTDTQARAHTAKIRQLNDQARLSLGLLSTAKCVMTKGVSALAPESLVKLLAKVREFNAFDRDNDPHGRHDGRSPEPCEGEHDFGKIEFEGADYFWKFDYYDAAGEYGSEDPSDPKQTTRVLTIARADEY